MKTYNDLRTGDSPFQRVLVFLFGAVCIALAVILHIYSMPAWLMWGFGIIGGALCVKSILHL